MGSFLVAGLRPPPRYMARSLESQVNPSSIPCPGEVDGATYIVKSAILRSQQSLKRYVYSEIGDSGGTQITQMLRILWKARRALLNPRWIPCPGEVKKITQWNRRFWCHKNHSNATYIVKSAILDAQQSLKCYIYIYGEIGDSEVTHITQTLRI